MYFYLYPENINPVLSVDTKCPSTHLHGLCLLTCSVEIVLSPLVGGVFRDHFGQPSEGLGGRSQQGLGIQSSPDSQGG